MACAVAFRLYVAAHLQLFRKGICHNQLHGNRRREQGFLFSQLGKLKASTRALYDASWRSRQAKDKTWGERGEYGRAGRFAEKGGQQVGSALQASTDNEKIKALYGNYGFWSWLRYWYLDSADFVTLMLMDKGYYDYDYQEPKQTIKRKTYEESVRSDAEIQEMLSRFGWGQHEKKQPLTPEQLQAEVMAEERKKQQS